MPRVRPKGGTTRYEPCKERKAGCSAFSHSQDVESTPESYDRYGKMIGGNIMPDHLRFCKGKCSEFNKADIPCIKQRHKSCCDRCDTLLYNCADFTHEDLALVDFMICDRCQTTVNTSHGFSLLEKHQRNCPGKCDQFERRKGEL